ncbi:MAG: hypothetical protein WC878_07175 [Candidatus Paceibacterota bacterium]|jgi:hypothetical protein
MSIGTLTFYQNHIPKIGETVYIVVQGKSFPTGCWRGVLTYIGDVGKSRIVPYKKIIDNHTACRARITNYEYPDCEPEGPYDVFPDAPGIGMVIDKLNDQKIEVKALKKRLEEKEQTSRDVLRGLLDLAGVKSPPFILQTLDNIYRPVVKK